MFSLTLGYPQTRVSMTYMLSHVGPKYDDLVDIYCYAHWGYPHPSYRKEDIWKKVILLV